MPFFALIAAVQSVRLTSSAAMAQSTLPRCDHSFDTYVTPFLSHRTLHKQYQERDRKRQHGNHPKDVEIGKRRCLLLAHIFELLPSQLLQCNRIGGLR